MRATPLSGTATTLPRPSERRTGDWHNARKAEGYTPGKRCGACARSIPKHVDAGD